MPLPDAFIILTPGFPASENDSTCLPLQQRLVKQLAQTRPGIKFIVLSFQYPYHTNTYSWHLAEVHCFNGRNKGGWVRLRNRQKIYKTLEQLRQQYRIRGLLSFWYGECALAGKRFAAEQGLLHRCWILGQDARTGNAYPRRVKAPATELIALSDFLQDEFQQSYGIRPAHLVPPAVDGSLFGKTPVQKDIDILGAGSLIPLKRYDIWVEVVEKIKNQIPAVKAVLVGEGPELKRLQRLVEKKNLQATISFMGGISYGQTLQLMQRARLLLHPSSYEGYSGVCQEALYAGARVISFCRAMKTDIDNWYIVNNITEMTAKAGALLLAQDQNELTAPSRTMDQLATEILRCFDISG